MWKVLAFIAGLAISLLVTLVGRVTNQAVTGINGTTPDTAPFIWNAIVIIFEFLANFCAILVILRIGRKSGKIVGWIFAILSALSTIPLPFDDKIAAMIGMDANLLHQPLYLFVAKLLLPILAALVVIGDPRPRDGKT
jgi:hypothetical protein